jgi:hypothetical protein
MQVKPTQQEEKYFARLEFERRRNALKERETQGAEEERQRILAVAAGAVSEVCRRVDPRLLSRRRAGQVLGLPGGVAGLRRARSGGGGGHRLPRRRAEDLHVNDRKAGTLHV